MFARASCRRGHKSHRLTQVESEVCISLREIVEWSFFRYRHGIVSLQPTSCPSLETPPVHRLCCQAWEFTKFTGEHM